MKRHAFAVLAVLAFSLALVQAQQPAAKKSAVESKVTSTPQWEKIKSLVGEWDGYASEAGQKRSTHVSMRLTGDGSAVMHIIDAGTPHEMVTMFNMDQTELLATHYCAAHNQPRLRAKSSAKPSEINFEFKDGTNIRPGDGHMSELTLTLVDADHHNETWGYTSNGKVDAGTFYMTRVKAAAKP
jgi:hypothetical protein